jgi:hypothetical protein
MELAERTKRSRVSPDPTPIAASRSLEEATAEETVDRVFELRASAMFPIDDQAAFAEQDKLDSSVWRFRQSARRTTAMRPELARCRPCRSTDPLNARSSVCRVVASLPTPSHRTISPRHSLAAFRTAEVGHGWQTGTKRATQQIRSYGI